MKYPALIGNDVKFVVRENEFSDAIGDCWRDFLPFAIIIQTIETQLYTQTVA